MNFVSSFVRALSANVITFGQLSLIGPARALTAHAYVDLKYLLVDFIALAQLAVNGRRNTCAWPALMHRQGRRVCVPRARLTLM